MPTRGDRVILEGNKVGGGRREGEILAVKGSFLEIRWPDGSSSLISPGPGVLRVVDGRRSRVAAPASRSGGKAKVKAAKATAKKEKSATVRKAAGKTAKGRAQASRSGKR